MLGDPQNPDLPGDIEERPANNSFNPIETVEAFTRNVRSRFAVTDSAQAEAYRQVAEIAKRVVAGNATDADKAILKARDVDSGTLNPQTGKPVKSVQEAAQLIVATEQIWYGVLTTTDVARKQAIAAVKAMSPSEIPRDLDAWLSENFQWLPENLS